MLLEDVRELLYKDVDTDNGPSPIINIATDDIECRGPLSPPDGAIPGDEPIVEYDPHQRVIRRTDANGHTTRFDYEGLTVPRRIAFADGNCLDFHFSDTGIIEKLLTGQTLLANYEVASDSGSCKVAYTDGTHAEFVIENGRITRAVNPSGTVELKYDNNGLLASEAFQGRTVTYHRNEAGHLIGLTTPFGQIIHYKRDRKNRVCCIKEWSGQDIRVDYAANGAMESISYPNGTRLCQQTTKDGRPAELRFLAPGTNETVLHKIYHRDHHSRITRIDDGKQEIVYAYDKEGRLTGAKNQRSGGYAFFNVDKKSNRLSDNHRQYSVNAADRVIRSGEIEFQYDCLGNLIHGTCPRGRARYQYCGLNRLGSFSLDSAQAQYRYDALGRRVAKKVNGVTTLFFWAGNQLLHEVQRRSAGDRKSIGVTDYLFFPGRPALLAIRRDKQTHWAAFGHRYEVLCLTADDGRPVWRAEYDSFGKADIKKGKKVFQPYRLAGQYRDDESGLHCHLSRYYDPELGRYLSMTPHFLKSGSDNFYIYGNGDPINHVDNDGVMLFAPILISDTIKSPKDDHTQAEQQHPAKTETDIFAIAKTALLGDILNSVFSRLGLRKEIAPINTVGGDASDLFFTKSSSLTERRRQGTKIDRHDGPALLNGLSDANEGIGLSKKSVPPLLRVSRRPRTDKMPTKSTADIASNANITSVPASEPAKIRDSLRIDIAHQCMESGHVNAITGEVRVRRIDFKMISRIPIIWSCHYQSRRTYTGLMGRGWQTPADARLEVDDKGSVLFFDGGTTGVLFEVLPTDTATVAAANGALLTATPEQYQVRLKSGLTYHFPKKFSESLSHVMRISDVHDNFLSFYREETELTQIQDSSDRYIHIKCEKGRITAMKWQDKPLAIYRYDGEHLTAAVDALGHQERYRYSNGVMVRHMDKNKHSFYFKYSKSGRCTRKWDDSGLFEYRFDYPPNENFTLVTDSIGHQRTYKYDHHLRTLIANNHTGTPSMHEYDEIGRIIKSTDKMNRSTTYQYDEAGNITCVMRANTQFLALTYNSDNRPVKLIDANGNARIQRFDDLGRLTEEINPLKERVKYSYNRHGDLATVEENGLTTVFEYDAHGLVSAVIHDKKSPMTYQRDAFGNTTAVVDPTGRTTRYVYDDKSRLIQAVQPSGISQSFDWDPEDNLLIHTDPNGRQTRFEYGAEGKLLRRRNPDDTSVSFQYDTEGNLINIINERGQCHHCKYDHAGRIAAQTDYYGHTHRFKYDHDGRLIDRTDPLKQVIAYTYDTLGRLKTKTVNGQEQALFNWDAIGNLISFQSNGVTVERHYDAANQLLVEKKGAFCIDYQYGSHGRASQRITSHGNRVQYSYDDMGAVSAIQINDHPPLTIERDDHGQITEEHFSASLHRSFSYDQDGLLIRQTISGSNGEIERRYSYDGAANLIAKQDNHKGDWRYSHDAMDRITEATDPQFQTHHVTYDPCGDIVDHLPEIKKGLRCTQYNNTRYYFDAAGNLVQRNDGEVEYRFEWDEQNRLITFGKGDEPKITMVYDALGRQHSKTVKDNTTIFNWQGHTLVSEQYEDGSAREYIYYPGTLDPVAVIDADKQIYYYHNDINGLPLELTKMNGEIVWSAGYDALGRVEQIYEDKVLQPLRLPGHYFDEELGLCYDGRRYFDPMTCAFISRKSLGPSGGENTYAYAPNVWAPIGAAGSCKTLLKNSTLRKRHSEIKNACVLPEPKPSPKFQHACFSGGILPSTFQI
jgi:RHS repeat-associated protein